MSNNDLSNFLNREKLEKSNLARKFFLGAFLDLKQLRSLRVGILRLLSSQLTSCEIDHENNGDEAKFQDRSFVGSFTKGLPHDLATGQVEDPEQFKRFRVATHKGDFFSDGELQLGKDSFNAVKVNGNKPVRAWESPAAGLTFEMHGPDSHSVTMPPAPALGSDQLTFEMAEVYWLALLRDIPFNQFQKYPVVEFKYKEDQPTIDEAIRHLNNLPWFQNGMPTAPGWERRQRKLQSGQDTLNTQTVFRGTTTGDIVGPYLSQFLLIGSPGHEKDPQNVTNGLIGYGALKIDQKLVPARLGLDHMTTWNVFIDVQDGANVGRTDVFKEELTDEEFLPKRFITYPRDLATYVHFDALYEAYLNACLILLDFGAPVDSGIAQLNNPRSSEAQAASASEFGKVDGFALFGAPHILNLVTEASTRALKAVRYQKFNVHCRLRPEALAGWMEAINCDVDAIKAIEELTATYNILNSSQDGINLLDKIKEHNGNQNTEELNNLRSYIKEEAQDNTGTQTALLPMAFPEGSPMHPAYGAGHATVAGACVTMLKAFFDTDAVLAKRGEKLVIDHKKEHDNPIAYVSTFEDGDYQKSMLQESPLTEYLTVGGELNKIAANISIGRNMAGVHYYTDYIDSLVMGEKIAIGILLEQSLAYEIYPKKVRPSFSLTTFLGKTLKIKDGKIRERTRKVPEEYQPIKWCEL